MNANCSRVEHLGRSEPYSLCQLATVILLTLNHLPRSPIFLHRARIALDHSIAGMHMCMNIRLCSAQGACDTMQCNAMQCNAQQRIVDDKAFWLT